MPKAANLARLYLFWINCFSFWLTFIVNPRSLPLETTPLRLGRSRPQPGSRFPSGSVVDVSRDTFRTLMLVKKVKKPCVRPNRSGFRVVRKSAISLQSVLFFFFFFDNLQNQLALHIRSVCNYVYFKCGLSVIKCRGCVEPAGCLYGRLRRAQECRTRVATRTTRACVLRCV